MSFEPPQISADSATAMLKDEMRYASFSMIEWLLSNGADVNCQNAFGFTALHYAAMYNHVKLVKLLLEHGADTQIQSLSGLRPVEMLSPDTYNAESIRNCTDLLLGGGLATKSATR